MSLQLFSRLLVALATAGALAAAARASGPQAFESALQPSGLVRLDAIVTDQAGNAILNLTAAEFELEEDGAVRVLESVEFDSRNRVETTPAPRLPIESAADEQREAERPGTRLFGLFLDEYHVDRATSDQVRDALTRFLDEEVRPEDLLVVMKPLDSLTTLRVTRDRDAIQRAIASFAGSKGDYAPRSSLERELLAGEPADVAVARAQIVVSALRALATHLGRLRTGRKALLVVSDGFVRPVSRRGERLPDLQSVARTANRLGVAVHALAPGGEVAAAPSAGGSLTESPEEALGTLRNLADETNGEMVVGATNLLPGLRRAAKDLTASYRLAYRSAFPGDGAFHKVRVRVKRPGARVRAATGFWASGPVERIAERTAADRSRRPSTPLMFRPQRRSPLIQPWFGVTRLPGGLTRVTFTWTPTRGSARAADISSVVLSVTTADGTEIFNGRVMPAGDEAGSDESRRAVFELRPGLVAIDISIQSADRKVIDADARNLDVPNLSGPRIVIGQPELLRTRSARQFRDLSADPAAPPTLVRQFSRTERLLIRVPAYGPGEALPSVSARLLNPIGQPMRTLATAPGPLVEGVTQFDLPLATFAPGEYRIEVTASSGSERTTELILFRVVN
jgi:VWFA-related protein